MSASRFEAARAAKIPLAFEQFQLAEGDNQRRFFRNRVKLSKSDAGVFTIVSGHPIAAVRILSRLIL